RVVQPLDSIGQLLQVLDGDQHGGSLAVPGDRPIRWPDGAGASTGPRTRQPASQGPGRTGQAICTAVVRQCPRCSSMRTAAARTRRPSTSTTAASQTPGVIRQGRTLRTRTARPGAGRLRTRAASPARWLSAVNTSGSSHRCSWATGRVPRKASTQARATVPAQVCGSGNDRARPLDHTRRGRRSGSGFSWVGVVAAAVKTTGSQSAGGVAGYGRGCGGATAGCSALVGAVADAAAAAVRTDMAGAPLLGVEAGDVRSVGFGQSGAWKDEVGVGADGFRVRLVPAGPGGGDLGV